MLALQRLRQRFHPELREARVCASNAGLIEFQARAALHQFKGWELVIERNEWFQTHALRQVRHLATGCNEGKVTLFAYSYAARRVMAYARKLGWRTVLGQIDPGYAWETAVARARQLHPTIQTDWQPAPTDYWNSWREECHLADLIVVNSEWSAQALQADGVQPSKIRVLPLAYEPTRQAMTVKRVYPAAFSSERPFNVLFLGSINLNKGVGEVFQAIRTLQGESVRFCFVGPVQVSIPADLRNHPQVCWFGAVPREGTSHYYQNADVLLFPTHSDGFGLTQLEAQTWQLPVIASKACGAVVGDGVNGLLLPEVTSEAIAGAVRRCLANPPLLATFAANSVTSESFSIARLRERLLALT